MIKKIVFLATSILAGFVFFTIAFSVVQSLYYRSVPDIQEYIIPTLVGLIIGGGIGLWNLRSQSHKDHLEEQITQRTAELEGSNKQLEKEVKELKKAEEALRESEEKFRNLVQNVPDLIIELNANGEVTSVNEPFLDNFIYELSDVIGQPFVNFLHPDDVEVLLQMFLEAIENHLDHAQGHQFRLVDKDGSAYWFELNANMKFDENGDYLQSFAVVRNINENRKAGEALKESENRYRFLSDNITDFMWIADLDLRRLKFLSSSVNRIGEGVYDTFMSLDINRTMIPESYQLASGILSEELRTDTVLKQGKNLTEEELNRFRILELGFHGLDGNTFWTETVIKFQRDENNNPIGVYGVARDINERKQSEDEMVKLISLIENSEDFIGLSTLEGDVQYINSTGLQMVGLDTVEEAKKSKIFDFFAESGTSRIKDDAMAVMLSNQHWINQTQFNNFKTRDLFPIEINAFVIKRPNSEDPAAIAMVGRNLTERQKIEEQLRQSQKMESLGTLAGGIAHDFNNILGVIVGYSNLVLELLPEESDERGYQEELIKASDRAINLINQIRSFSRTHQIDLKPTLMTPLIQEAVKMMRAVIPATIEFKAEIDPDCGRIMADETQIQQIIINLCNNAVHAMKNKGVINISLSQVRSADIDYFNPDLTPGNYLKLAIKDSGQGMAKRVKERIFEPFYSTKKVNEGTGLGLSIVHGIVESHKGLIHVDSAPKKGSEFNILLPVVQGEFIEEPKKQERTKNGKGKGHILVVDDEVTLTKYYALALGKVGYEVTQMNDGESALKLFQENPDRFDIIFTDQTMPNLTGTQLSREILSIKPNIPIVLATGFTGTVPESELTELKFSSFLTKPIKLSALLSSMNLASSQGAKKKEKRRKSLPGKKK